MAYPQPVRGRGQTYSAEAPEAILTPDVLETQRLGTLRFFDGMPDEDTVRKTYDNLDFMRGVEAFLSGMPAACLYAMCSGLEDAGLPAHSVGITEDLLDARALWLTANSTTVYVTTCLDLKQGPCREFRLACSASSMMPSFAGWPMWA